MNQWSFCMWKDMHVQVFWTMPGFFLWYCTVWHKPLILILYFIIFFLSNYSTKYNFAFRWFVVQVISNRILQLDLLSGYTLATDFTKHSFWSTLWTLLLEGTENEREGNENENNLWVFICLSCSNSNVSEHLLNKICLRIREVAHPRRK